MFPRIISHRGANTKAPENTLEAFTLGLEDGADGIELDVQLSKDGELMVIHDETLNRTTNMQGPVCSYTCRELQQADASKALPGKFKNVRIPTLREVMEFIRPTGKLMNIELKTGIIIYQGIEEKVIQLVREFDYVENTILSSFNHYSLKKVKEILPEIKTGALYVSGLYCPHLYIKTLGADGIHPLYFNVMNATPEQWEPVKASGIIVNAYTVNGEREMKILAEKGVTGLITDVPHVAAELRRAYHE